MFVNPWSSFRDVAKNKYNRIVNKAHQLFLAVNHLLDVIMQSFS